MKINIQSPGFTAKEELLSFVNDSANKLLSYTDMIVSCDVVLRVENAEPEKNKSCNVRLGVPGNDLIASTQAKSFEEAVSSAMEILERQIKKRKDKMGA